MVVWSIVLSRSVCFVLLSSLLCVLCRCLSRVRLVSSPKFFCTVFVMMGGSLVAVVENPLAPPVVFVGRSSPLFRLFCSSLRAASWTPSLLRLVVAVLSSVSGHVGCRSCF